MKQIAFILFALSGLVAPAVAQQTLTEWRASLDTDLSKLSMPREAHATIYNLLQAYERQAQIDKAREAAKAKAPPPHADSEGK